MTDRWPRFINELMIEIRSATYGRKVDPDDLRKNLPLVPAESIASRALVTVIAIMAFLAAFVAGIGALIQSAASDWTDNIAHEMTIQVRPTANRDIEQEVAKAANIRE